MPDRSDRSASPQGPDAQLARAVDLHRQGRLDEAAAAYVDLFNAYPGALPVLRLLGTLRCQQGRFEEGAALLRRHVERDPTQADAFATLGDALARLGRPDEAVAALGRAVALKPDFVQAHFRRGTLLSGSGRHAEALACYERVIELAPAAAEAHCNRAVELAALGRAADALASADRAVALKPALPEAQVQRGIALFALGRAGEAADSFGRALALRPDYAEAWLNRGNALQAGDRPAEALADYDRALALRPEFPEAWLNRADALHRLARPDEAIESCARALALRPAFAEAHCTLGVLLNERGRVAAAVDCYGRALAARPDYVQAHCNRGAALLHLQRLDAALADYDRAVELAPRDPQAWNGRAAVLRGLGRLADALADNDRAIECDAGNAEAWADRGGALHELGRLDEALAAYDRALALGAADPIEGRRHLLRLQMCRWDGFDETLARLRQRIEAGAPALPPFDALLVLDSPALQRRVAEAWTSAHFDATAVPLTAVVPSPASALQSRDGRIRLGYFSADFHNHATMHLLAEVLERHDRTRFEIVGFSFGPRRDDAWRRRALAACDEFHEVATRSDDEVVALARSSAIDIAIDLKGYTKDSRPGLFARRCAPVQASFLGYPGTMGARFIDYLVADRTIVPVDAQAHYAEKIIYLPHCYQPNCGSREVADAPRTRAEAGLPDAGFVFCCFNNNNKLTPAVFDAWMQILRRVDGSVLWLFESNRWAAQNLGAEAERRGIGRDRLVFAPRLPVEQHLARLRLADLFLDTWPCNAHTTASDALRMGVPLLTLAGATFAGRVAASLLHALALDELVAADAAQYEALAVALAADAPRLAALRARLARQVETAPLFDAATFARHLEDAYAQMAGRHARGLPPDTIDVRA